MPSIASIRFFCPSTTFLHVDVETSGELTVGETVVDTNHRGDGEPNVHVFPPVDRPDLPGLVAAADVCLVPHVRTPLTEAMSPLKLYEYLAAGRPVAAVDLPPILGVSDRVSLATAGSSFLPAVEEALALGPASEDDRLAFILENDWKRRFELILDVALAG